jgi:serine/threonine protein kinase
LKGLSHGLIVQYKGFVEKSDKSSLMIEYVSNGDLFHKMRMRRLNRKEVIFIAAEIVEALDYLHR